MKLIGEKIRNIRIEKNITQVELSSMTSIKQTIISRYENGKIVPPLYRLEAISKALGVQISKLMDEETS